MGVFHNTLYLEWDGVPLALCDELDGVPTRKRHCSANARGQQHKAAVADWNVAKQRIPAVNDLCAWW